jgi:hypothetical protein
MTDATPSNGLGKKNTSPNRKVLAAACERRQPSGLDFALADRIGFLNAEHWAVILCRRPCGSSTAFRSSIWSCGNC